MAAHKHQEYRTETDRLEVAADEAIAACSGDLRSTIRALILANEYLEFELCELFKAVSNAPARQKFESNLADDSDETDVVLPVSRADWYD